MQPDPDQPCNWSDGIKAAVRRREYQDDVDIGRRKRFVANHTFDQLINDIYWTIHGIDRWEGIGGAMKIAQLAESVNEFREMHGRSSVVGSRVRNCVQKEIRGRWEAGLLNWSFPLMTRQKPATTDEVTKGYKVVIHYDDRVKAARAEQQIKNKQRRNFGNTTYEAKTLGGRTAVAYLSTDIKAVKHLIVWMNNCAENAQSPIWRRRCQRNSNKLSSLLDDIEDMAEDSKQF
jgi:hypothetical protein